MLTWVINKVAKVIEFVVLLTIGFFWLHNILLSLLGVSFLVFANDFVTMSLATDNVKHTSNPNKWNVKNNILASLIPALFYVLGDVLENIQKAQIELIFNNDVYAWAPFQVYGI